MYNFKNDSPPFSFISFLTPSFNGGSGYNFEFLNTLINNNYTLDNQDELKMGIDNYLKNQEKYYKNFKKIKNYLYNEIKNNNLIEKLVYSQEHFREFSKYMDNDSTNFYYQLLYKLLIRYKSFHVFLKGLNKIFENREMYSYRYLIEISKRIRDYESEIQDFINEHYKYEFIKPYFISFNNKNFLLNKIYNIGTDLFFNNYDIDSIKEKLKILDERQKILQKFISYLDEYIQKVEIEKNKIEEEFNLRPFNLEEVIEECLHMEK